jgi:hypothetical protein
MNESGASTGNNDWWISRYYEGVAAEFIAMAKAERASKKGLSPTMKALLCEVWKNFNSVLDFEFAQMQQARRQAGGTIDEIDVATINADCQRCFEALLEQLLPSPPSRRACGRDRRIVGVGEDNRGYRAR